VSNREEYFTAMALGLHCPYTEAWHLHAKQFARTPLIVVMRRKIQFLIAFVLSAGSLIAGSYAQAALPGKDGRIFQAISETRVPITTIYSVRPDGSGPRIVRQIRAKWMNGLTVNGTGKWLAYHARRGADHDIYVVPTDGSRPPINITKESEANELEPSFGPGGELAFTHDPVDGDSDILVRQRWRGGEEVNLTRGSPGDDFAPSFSPLGDRVVFTSREGQGDVPDYQADDNEISIASLDPDSQLIQLTDNDIRDTHPDFSPDGSQISFTRQSVGPPPSYAYTDGVWLMNGDGSEPTLLTGFTNLEEHEAGVGSPAFSPSGRSLIFRASFRFSSYDTIIHDLTDGSQREFDFQETEPPGGNHFDIPSYAAWGPR
jgi:hypothetical protein